MARSPSETSSVKRLVLIAPDGLSLLRQRAELVADILAKRHSILALIPEHAAASIPALNENGMAAATFPLRGDAPSLLGDGKTVTSIATTLADWRAHVLLAAGPKTMLLGALAANNAGVTRRVGLVTALPAAMMSDDKATAGWGWQRLMKTGFKALDAAVFHNDTHCARLRANGFFGPEFNAAVVAGAGVDLERHAVKSLPPLVDRGAPALNFAMIARIDAAKGVAEFCQAAALIRKKAPETRFILAGPDGNLDRAALSRYGDNVEIIGDQADVRPLLAAAHVVVLPSWGEGMPRILLEALATGRPIITTNIAGARETVDERVNGVLVPPKDAVALAEAMESFLKRPDLIPAMARASRSKAERRFDVRPVNTALMQILGL